MAQARGYSLWFMPGGGAAESFGSLMNELSRKYHAPMFEPHVTLLGGIERPEHDIVQCAEKLAHRLRPLTIVLTTADTHEAYFQCLFLRVRQTRPILEAQRTARAIFGRGGDPPYLPHMSLLYGIYDPKTKQEIIARIGTNFPRRFSVVDLHLWRTQGEPENWASVHVSSLGPQRASVRPAGG